MSGMDRLTDEALVDNIMALKGYQGDDFGDDLVSRLEVLSILSRRASQAAPAEEWEACTCGPCPLHPAAPAPSDGLREAVDAAWNDAIEAGWAYIETCLDEPETDADAALISDMEEGFRALRRAAPTEDR